MTIGIPKALFYWKEPFSAGAHGGHFWKTFFENLGVEIILSPETNKEIIEKGVKVSDPETCFATKVFLGHILWLEGKVDFVFVPRLKTNEEKLEYCPKFFGLPDLAKILVKTPILTETFDVRKDHYLSTHPKKGIPTYLTKALWRLGKKLGIDNKKIKKSTDSAFLKEKKSREKQKENFFRKIKSEKQKIVLISHPYNLYDDYINVGMKKKLEKLGAEVIFIDEVPIEGQGTRDKGRRLNYPEFHWEFGKEIMEKIEEILKYSFSGAIEVSSFLCGCDAVLKEFVEKAFKENKIPFLYLIIDENTADAGLQTRLEAFIDTLH
ncbi:hypothetical protein KJA16_02120 [Patescibacteria group bacterium]|nr:hypothetical protein [Patescibacteria group bacterium]